MSISALSDGRVDRQQLLGAGLMVASSGFVVANQAIIKTLADTMAPVSLVFWRDVVVLGLLLPWFVWRGCPRIRGRAQRLLWMRAAAYTGGSLAWFTAVSLIDLSVASALSFSSILFSVALGAMLLGERMGWVRWLATLAGLAGVLVILRPGVIPIDRGSALALITAFAFAVAMVVAKLQMRAHGPLVVAVWLALLTLPVSGAVAAANWTTPLSADLPWLLLLGVFALAGQLTFMEAMRRADAAVVIPIDLTRLVWAVVLGFVLFGERPDLFMLIGGALIAGSAVVLGLARGRPATPPGMIQNPLPRERGSR